MTKLYVDKFLSDTTSIVGGTTDYKKILHNVKTLENESLVYLLNELSEHKNIFALFCKLKTENCKKLQCIFTQFSFFWLTFQLYLCSNFFFATS